MRTQHGHVQVSREVHQQNRRNQNQRHEQQQHRVPVVLEEPVRRQYTWKAFVPSVRRSSLFLKRSYEIIWYWHSPPVLEHTRHGMGSP